MKKGIIAGISFVIGAGIGYFAANRALADRYEQLVQEEVDSVKKSLAKYHTESNDMKPENKNAGVRRSRVTRQTDYTTFAADSEKKINVNAAKVISVDEFGEIFDYDTESFTYYAGDQVVTDEMDHRLSDEDVAATVGKECLSCFNEAEADGDIVYVRNDRRHTDYEILLDKRSYAEILEQKPYLREE